MKTPLIFQIGFNKCGSVSLHRFCEESGIPAVHFNSGKLAQKITARINAGEDPVADYPHKTAFTDMNYIGSGEVLLEPFKRFDYLHAWHPDALFILNTRDRENWIASRLAYGSEEIEPPYNSWLSRYCKYLGVSSDEAIEYWRADWTVHHVQARAYFRDNPRFLEFHIERDDPARLSEFVGEFHPKAKHVELGRYNYAH